MKISDFENKKIVIFVPHQDDEIHLAGNIIASLKDTSNIYLVYITNGDFIYNAKYRYKEALKSLKVLGKIPKERVIFLGYPDQPYDQKSHMYNTDDNWISNANIKETYAPKGFKEWTYIKNNSHAKCNKNNILKDIKEIITEIKPEIILCNDLDFHCDHIMTSLIFEKALGEVLKEDKNYKPLVLKGFTYENSYLGPDDFYDKYYKEMKHKCNDDDNLINNPYYNINNSVCININRCCYTKNLFKNKIFKAILKHKSQLLLTHVSGMINYNQVYFERRTDNLMFTSKIEVSSGNSVYLNDYMLLDTSNVLNGDKKKIIYDKGIWIPNNNDKEKYIKIILNEEKYIDTIKLYNGCINKDYISNIRIVIDGEKNNIKLTNNLVNTISVNKKCKNIIIYILDKDIKNGFSEIEILENDSNIYNNEKPEIKRSNKFINITNFIFIKILIFIQKVYRKILIR